MIKALDELLNSALTHERNADVAGSRGEWSEAAEYLRKAVALAPMRASPHHKLGTALFYLKDRRGAVEEFQEALRLSPDLSAAHYALGVLHDEAGAYQQAIGSFSAALVSEPGNVDARLGLAERVETQRSARTIVVGVRARLEGRFRCGRGAFWLRGGARPPQSISRRWLRGWLRR